MSKKLIIEQLLKECDNLLESFQCTVSPAMEKRRDEKLQEIHILASNLSFTFSVIDMNLQTLIFHETNHPDWMHSEVIKTHDPDNLHAAMMYTHPDDKVFLHRINLFILTKLKEMPLDRVKEFEIRFFRRMKNMSGKYCFCQQRISVLACNDAGKAWLLKSFTTHPFLPEDLLEYQIRLFRMYPLDLYHGKRNVSEEEPVELTRLQYEILLLHTDGLTIMEIAVKTGTEAETIKEKLQVIRDKTGITSIKKLGAFAKLMNEMI